MKVGTITEELRERICAENDLAEVAAEYGIEFGAGNKAVCPFHDDEAPSLHYYPNNNTYHCYCSTCRAGTRWDNKEERIPHKLTLPDGVVIEDAGSDVIGFIQNLERCSFVEACMILMERAGIEIPKAKVNRRHEKMKKEMTEDNLLFFRTLMKNKAMLQYLEDRSISKESIKKFRLGVVPNSYSHPHFGSLVRGRLVFGITEPSYNPKKARTIAMAYRDLHFEKGSKGHGAKYINDKESEIYHKSSLLYGMNEARRAIRDAGYAIVMEGYMDVITSHESGIENAVGICGTSFTDEQMDILMRLTKNLVFWLDGDNAGQKAMRAALPRLLARGFKVMILTSRDRDPAEQMIYMHKNEKAIRKYISAESVPARIWIAEQSLREYEVKVQKMKAEVLEELMPIADIMADPTDRILFKNMIADRLHIRL